MESEQIKSLSNRYELFIEKLEINKNGILGKISNQRYKEQKLRFAGFPYIGSKFSVAKKKILFVGLDNGIDELREENSFHNFNSRREIIAGSKDGCTDLDYNDHISGTYAMALFLLQKYYSWENEWKTLKNIQNVTSRTAINSFKNSLPIGVLDYVSLTNIHKFVSVCRGCDIKKRKPECFNQLCLDENRVINRSGNYNRKWYNKQDEINLLLDEIKILKPDLVYFQGSSVKLDSSVIYEINSLCDICIAYHPSAWNVGANRVNYADKIIIRQKIQLS